MTSAALDVIEALMPYLSDDADAVLADLIERLTEQPEGLLNIELEGDSFRYSYYAPGEQRPVYAMPRPTDPKVPREWHDTDCSYAAKVGNARRAGRQWGGKQHTQVKLPERGDPSQSYRDSGGER
jgi:hypothetical protein